MAVLAAALSAFEWARLELEKGLSRFLKLPVRIQRLSISPQHLTLHNVSFGSPSWAPVRIERLQLEGWKVWGSRPAGTLTLTGMTLSVAGVPMQAQGRVQLTGRPGTYAHAEGWLTLEHPFLSGNLEVSGRLLKPVVFGWLEGARVGRRHFVSQWDLRRDRVRLGSLQMQGGWTAEGELLIHDRQDRGAPWRGDLQVAGPQDRFRLGVTPSETGSTQATLWAHREGVPPTEFSGEWIVRGGSMHFQAGLMDRQAVLTGQMSLRFPYATDLVLDLDGLHLSDVLDWLPGEVPPRVAGRVEGRIRLSFVFPRTVSRGELSASNGRFGWEEFREMRVRFQGEGPVLRLENSRVTKANGTALMDGTVDLRLLGHPDFFRLVKLTPVRGNPDREGWQVGPALQDAGVALRHFAPREGATVGLANRVDTGVPQEPVEREGVEVQVPLSDEQRLSVRMDGQEEFLGVEHRKKF